MMLMINIAIYPSSQTPTHPHLCYVLYIRTTLLIVAHSSSPEDESQDQLIYIFLC